MHSPVFICQRKVDNIKSREKLRKINKIVIIGAGIAGLTAAASLRRFGFEPEVYEQAPQLGEVGAGLQLGPNAVKVLRALGLEERLLKVASEPTSIVSLNWNDATERFREPLRAISVSSTARVISPPTVPICTTCFKAWCHPHPSISALRALESIARHRALPLLSPTAAKSNATCWLVPTASILWYASSCLAKNPRASLSRSAGAP
jgi:hypothetical protein